MKTSTGFLVITFMFLLTIGSRCKKENTNNYVTCACNTDEVKYILKEISGTLSYYEFNKRWVFSYSPLPGNYSNFFPCNSNHNSLQAILSGANSDQTFQVSFSGKIKAPCPNEIFGITSGVTTFDYIIIDSLKRN